MNRPTAAVVIFFLLVCVTCLLLSLTPKLLQYLTHTHTHTQRHSTCAHPQIHVCTFPHMRALAESWHTLHTMLTYIHSQTNMLIRLPPPHTHTHTHMGAYACTTSKMFLPLFGAWDSQQGWISGQLGALYFTLFLIAIWPLISIQTHRQKN